MFFFVLIYILIGPALQSLVYCNHFQAGRRIEERNVDSITKMILRTGIRSCFSKYSTEPSTSQASATSQFVSTVGLEVHAQISSQSKLFSGAEASFGGRPNRSVALFDYAAPGTLPVLNRCCVEKGLQTSAALNCRINPVSRFDRKHYFYADLPSGYQITQLSRALANDGHLDFHVFDVKHCPNAYRKRISITQLQLEQDSGKSIQDQENNRALIDLNRAGVALMEIITGPNLSNGVEAQSFVRELILILKQIQSCDCGMDKGQLRVDANISVRPSGTETLGTRTEVKNLNSLKFIRKAIDYEIRRQINEVENGRAIVNETRTFDFKSGKTVPMRDKEEKQDYRFMPEPNLPFLRLSPQRIKELRSELPVLIVHEKEKWISSGVPPGDAIFILEDWPLTEFFRRCFLVCPKEAVPKLTEAVVYTLRYKLMTDKLTYSECTVEPTELVDLVNYASSGRITDRTYSSLLSRLYKKEVSSISGTISDENLWKIEDDMTIRSICEGSIQALSSGNTDIRRKKGRKKLILRGLQAANFRIEDSVLEEKFIEILGSEDS